MAIVTQTKPPIDTTRLQTIVSQLPGVQTPMTTPMVPGGPKWFTGKNALIGGGVMVGLYAAYLLLTPPPPKKAAPAVAGFGWLFGRRKRRHRR